MSTLYICEKPSQARDIAKFLNVLERKEGYIQGSGVIVTWCLGHLLELAPPDYYRTDLKPWRRAVLPVIPEQWIVLPCAKTKSQLNIIGKLLKKAQSVVVATDADREGSLIAHEILTYFHYKGKIERLWLSSLDDVSIKKALNDLKPESFSKNLYLAGLYRAYTDWLIGINLSMAATVLLNNKNESGVLSVGRVQTPTLKLIVDRDRLIENFKPKDYYTVSIQFTQSSSDKFWVNWQPDEFEADEEGRCINLHHAESVLKFVKTEPSGIDHFEQLEKKRQPPLCLSLSQLQKIASSQLGLSAKQTLDVAQALYEKHKATTYPRTDCGYLPESQHVDANQILNSLGIIDPSLNTILKLCNSTIKSLVWNDKKISAHHAIIPTLHSMLKLDSLNLTEKNVYDLIRRHYIAQFLGDYVYEQRQVGVKCASYLFTATCNTPIKLGWKEVFDRTMIDDEAEETDDNQWNIIPILTKGKAVQYLDSKLGNNKTKPPVRFTEGTLISAMKSIARYVDDPAIKKILQETAGIGTEATRANIIETLFKRSYIEKQKKYIVSTDKGRYLIDAMPEIVKSPITTAHWEHFLDEIANGRANPDEFLSEQIESLNTMLEQLDKQCQ